MEDRTRTNRERRSFEGREPRPPPLRTIHTRSGREPRPPLRTQLHRYSTTYAPWDIFSSSAELIRLSANVVGQSVAGTNEGRGRLELGGVGTGRDVGIRREPGRDLAASRGLSRGTNRSSHSVFEEEGVTFHRTLLLRCGRSTSRREGRR